MKFGYARVSTNEQNLNLQLDALLGEGIENEHIYADKVTGSGSEREKLDELFKVLRKGDVLYVWKMDRMARSLIHFTKIANLLESKGVSFKSITEKFLDTTGSSPHGKFLVNIFASLAQFEIDLIKERTNAGLDAARKRGQILGPPRGLSEKAKQKAMIAEEYQKEGKLSVSEILEKLKISRGTYYKYLRYRKISPRIYKPRKK